MQIKELNDVMFRDAQYWKDDITTIMTDRQQQVLDEMKAFGTDAQKKILILNDPSLVDKTAFDIDTWKNVQVARATACSDEFDDKLQEWKKGNASQQAVAQLLFDRRFQRILRRFGFSETKEVKKIQSDIETEIKAVVADVVTQLDTYTTNVGNLISKVLDDFKNDAPGGVYDPANKLNILVQENVGGNDIFAKGAGVQLKEYLVKQEAPFAHDMGVAGVVPADTVKVVTDSLCVKLFDKTAGPSSMNTVLLPDYSK